MNLSYFLDFWFPKIGGRDIHTYLPTDFFSNKNQPPKQILVTNEALTLEVLVALDYDLDWVRELIHRAKFAGEFAIAEELAEVLWSKWLVFNSNYNPDLVTYVPWDPVRLVQRGYHLPQKIAQVLAKRLGLECVSVFIKKQSTISQVELTAASRKTALKNMFLIDQNFTRTNKRWLLVDDVVTTGATLLECKRALAEKKLDVEILGLVVAG